MFSVVVQLIDTDVPPVLFDVVLVELLVCRV